MGIQLFSFLRPESSAVSKPRALRFPDLLLLGHRRLQGGLQTPVLTRFGGERSEQLGDGNEGPAEPEAGESSLWKLLGLRFPSAEEAGWGRTGLQPLQVEAGAAEAEPRAGRSVSRGRVTSRRNVWTPMSVSGSGHDSPWLGGRVAGRWWAEPGPVSRPDPCRSVHYPEPSPGPCTARGRVRLGGPWPRPPQEQMAPPSGK